MSCYNSCSSYLYYCILTIPVSGCSIVTVGLIICHVTISCSSYLLRKLIHVLHNTRKKDDKYTNPYLYYTDQVTMNIKVNSQSIHLSTLCKYYTYDIRCCRPVVNH